MSEPPASELKKRPCCGEGCENCPYNPRHSKGNTTLAPEHSKSAGITTALRRARQQTDTSPTPQQSFAGNYAKGELDFRGIKIKIENPRNTERVGYDKDGNETWRRKIVGADYGYVKNTKAKDGDAVDVFIGPDHTSDLVYAIDQTNKDGSYDETKFIIGVKSEKEAKDLYLKQYPNGWTCGPISSCTFKQFAQWVKDGKSTQPFAGQQLKAASQPNFSMVALYNEFRLCVRKP